MYNVESRVDNILVTTTVVDFVELIKCKTHQSKIYHSISRAYKQTFLSSLCDSTSIYIKYISLST